MNIKNYYQSQFRNDMNLFIGNSNFPYFGHDWESDCKRLEKISKEKRKYFLFCLYFTVLVDQAVYTYYRNNYQEFQKLTKYPKFCHGLSQFQKNPRKILCSPVDNGFVDKNEILSIIEEGINLFIDEVVDFSQNYFKYINVKDFFNNLLYDKDVQIPEIFVILDNETKNQIEYIVYKMLYKCVQEKFGDGPKTFKA